MEPIPLGMGTDPDDGGAVWAPPTGTPLLPGLLAWQRLTVGQRRETWLCWSVELWEPVVVKVVRPGWRRPLFTRSLAREVRAMRPLRHPAFPRLLADGERSPLPHVVTEFLNGIPLDQVIDEDGGLSAVDVANLAVDLLSAVRHLHGTGTAHLDICPDNVLILAERGRLIDLGAARPLGAVLRRGEKTGTDGYQAPELAGWAGGPVTPAMDLYSLGATLRRALVESTDETGAISEVLGQLTDEDPGRRPTPDAALAAFVRHAGSRQYRPWPRWADRHLRRPRRAGSGAGAVDGPGESGTRDDGALLILRA